MTRAMNPQMRMSFASIRPSLTSRLTLRVPLARPLPIHHRHGLPPHHHHHHHRPRQRIRLVLPLSSRTWCLTSQPVSRLTGMRPKSTASSSSRMWRSFGLTCAPSLPTRPPSFVINGHFRTSFPSFSLSTSCFAATTTMIRPITREVSYTLSLSFIDIGDNCLGGCG